MAFLQINGIELGGEIAADSLSEERREIGETSAAFDGTLRKSRQSIKRDMSFSTVPMTSANALAWESLLQGLGEVWSFNTGFYGSKGKGPSSTTGLAISGSSPFHGAGKLTITTGNSITLASVCTGVVGTAIFFRKEGAGSWEHWVVLGAGNTDDDQVYKNATLEPHTGSLSWHSLSGGTLVLSAGAGTDSFDDLIVLPFLVPTDWIAGLYARHILYAWRGLPALAASGDIVPEVTEATARTVMGSVSMSAVKAYVDGSFRTNAKQLSVSLSEV